MERDTSWAAWPRDAWRAHKWLGEARRWAKHLYCYEEMIDDDLTFFHSCYEADDDPADAVEKFAGKYGLVRCVP